MFDGFYKVDYHAGEVIGRSVMHVAGGCMLGGNSSFAHIGSFTEKNGLITGRLAGQRHAVDRRFRTLYGDDDAEVDMRGWADGDRYRFESTPVKAPGVVLHSLMTRLDDGSLPAAGDVGEGGVVSGLYSVRIRLRDGLAGGLTGVMVLSEGHILGGDAFFYYLGSYSSANGRWKGEIINQEHTAAKGEPVFGGHEVGIGFSGECDLEGADWNGTALAGKRSLQLSAKLTLLQKA